MKIADCKTNHLTNPIGYFMEKPVFGRNSRKGMTNEAAVFTGR